MSKADREVARTIKAFREFIFTKPKSRSERLWKQWNIRIWLFTGALVICTLIFAIFSR